MTRSGSKHLEDDRFSNKGERDRTTQSNKCSKVSSSEKDGVLEFLVDRIHPQLVCSLCEGFFRDPYTTTRCQHTFCHSCLGITIDAGRSTCPTCDTYLGKDITKFSLPDHVLQDLIDKVLFPGVAAQDVQQEKEFYRKRGIEPKLDVANGKPSPGAASGNRKKRTRRRVNDTPGSKNLLAQEITVEVTPHRPSEDPADSIEYPILRTTGSLRIGQVKKFLEMKLKEKQEREQDKKMTAASAKIQTGCRSIEVLCDGTMLGDELTLAFVSRTVWRESMKHHLVLSYQYAPNR